MGFETKSRSEGDPATGRFAALKVLGARDLDGWIVGIFSGVFDAMPTVAEVADRPFLSQQRFSFGGELAISGVSALTAEEQERLTILGHAPITAHEGDLARSCRSISSAISCMTIVESEWRWENDRENFEAEIETARVRRAARQAAEEEADFCGAAPVLAG